MKYVIDPHMLDGEMLILGANGTSVRITNIGGEVHMNEQERSRRWFAVALVIFSIGLALMAGGVWYMFGAGWAMIMTGAPVLIVGIVGINAELQ